jgi:hypothetical protein
VKLAAVAILALVFAGCGGARVVAWKPTRPTAPPAPRRAAPCRANQLATTSDFNGATQQIVVNVAVRNVATQPCWLGTPSLRFAGGEPITVQRNPWYGDDPLQRLPRSSLRALAPGKTAVLLLVWSSTGICPGKPLRLVMRLPGGATLAAGRYAPTACAGGGASIGLADWVPAPRLAHFPLRAEILGRHVNGRVVFHARRNNVLDYEVALVNVSAKPFRFDGCPTYVQELGQKDVRLLNCGSVRAIPPGGRVVFAMQVLVRGSGEPGRLFWYLPRAAGEGVGADADVVVTG